jgi:hypothetical protein
VRRGVAPGQLIRITGRPRTAGRIPLMIIFKGP